MKVVIQGAACLSLLLCPCLRYWSRVCVQSPLLTLNFLIISLIYPRPGLPVHSPCSQFYTRGRNRLQIRRESFLEMDIQMEATGILVRECYDIRLCTVFPLAAFSILLTRLRSRYSFSLTLLSTFVYFVYLPANVSLTNPENNFPSFASISSMFVLCRSFPVLHFCLFGFLLL